MDEFDQAFHDVKEALAKRRELIFQATLLDQDNRPLSTGQGLIEDVPDHGVFWPENPSQPDIPPCNEAILRRLDASEVRILNFRKCDAICSSVHYHFRTE